MTWRRLVAVALVLGAVLSPALVPTGASAHEVDDPAGRQQEITEELESLQGHLDEAVAAEADLLADYQATKARRQTLDREVAALDRRIAAAATELRDAQEALDSAEARYHSAQTRLRAVEAALAAAKAQLREQAVAAYMGSGTELSMMLDAATDAHNITQLGATSAYIDAVLEAQQTIVDQHEALREAADHLVGEMEASRQEALGLRDRLQERTGELEAIRAGRVDVLRQALAEAAHEQSLLEQVRDKQAEYESRIADLQAESDSIAAFLQSQQSGQGVILPGDGVLASPIPGAPITSLYGPRVHPIFGTVRMHTGIDFGAGAGTPIHAAEAGRVVWAGYRGGYGLCTIVDHGGSLATLYAHQSHIGVKLGQIVGRNQVVGNVGSTGYATGPHLHFEVRVAGNPVDPLPYL